MAEHQYTQQPKKTDSTSQKQTIPPKQIPTSHPAAIIQRARINPKSLTHADVMQLQRTIGNKAVGRLLTEIGLIPSKATQVQPVQMQPTPEEEKEPLQGKIAESIQRQEIPKEEEPLQGKMADTVQRQEIPEEEEPLQTKRENDTGMPDNLKAGVENLSGIDMSNVRVHYNSDKPAKVGALAHTQGTNIHVAPGQEKYLPHEAWHVVQQTQGRVKPTMQLKGLAVNDNEGLELEADEMGEKSTRMNMKEKVVNLKHSMSLNNINQMKFSYSGNLIDDQTLVKISSNLAGNSKELFDTYRGHARIYKIETFLEKHVDSSTAEQIRKVLAIPIVPTGTVIPTVPTGTAIPTVPTGTVIAAGTSLHSSFEYDSDKEETMEYRHPPTQVNVETSKKVGAPVRALSTVSTMRHVAKAIRHYRKGDLKAADSSPVVSQLPGGDLRFLAEPNPTFHDVKVTVLTPGSAPGTYKRKGKASPYQELASKIDSLLKSKSIPVKDANAVLLKFYEHKEFKKEDINPAIDQTLFDDLNELAGIIILSDFARASKAHELVSEEILTDTPFMKRFGTKSPTYRGAIKHGGSKKLQEYTEGAKK
jgi:hypothetical protein